MNHRRNSNCLLLSLLAYHGFVLGSFANSRIGPRIKIESEISRNFAEGFSDMQPGEMEELLWEPKDELIKELVKSVSEEAWGGNCKHSVGQ